MYADRYDGLSAGGLPMACRSAALSSAIITHLADLQRPFLRHGEEARGQDVHARLEVEQTRGVVDGGFGRGQRLADERGQRRQRAIDAAEARREAVHHRKLIDVALRRWYGDL